MFSMLCLAYISMSGFMHVLLLCTDEDCIPLREIVELLLHLLQFVAQIDEQLHHLGVAVHGILVLLQHLAGGGELEAAHLHEVVYHTDLLDVLLGILAHVVARGLGLDGGNLLLPEAQHALGDTEHLGHLLDGVI